jgi:hypothetical protein
MSQVKEGDVIEISVTPKFSRDLNRNQKDDFKRLVYSSFWKTNVVNYCVKRLMQTPLPLYGQATYDVKNISQTVSDNMKVSIIGTLQKVQARVCVKINPTKQVSKGQ